MKNIKSMEELYEYLHQKAQDGTEFTCSDLEMVVTEWSGTTAKTYLGKQLKTIVQKVKSGTYCVRREFLEIDLERFLRLVSQKEVGLATYRRISHVTLVTYEFLLPLANEDELRRTLDGLFYEDTLRKRVENIAPAVLERIVARAVDESREAHLKRTFDKVAQLFWGYSIFHVSGRFRADDLRSRKNAIGRRYIVDETTAVVRFIFPCQSTRTASLEHFTLAPSKAVNPKHVEKEIDFIRNAFLELFVELIVVKVLEEDEIWVMESANNESKLYIWQKVT